MSDCPTGPTNFDTTGSCLWFYRLLNKKLRKIKHGAGKTFSVSFATNKRFLYSFIFRNCVGPLVKQHPSEVFSPFEGADNSQTMGACIGHVGQAFFIDPAPVPTHGRSSVSDDNSR